MQLLTWNLKKKKKNHRHTIFKFLALKSLEKEQRSVTQNIFLLTII